MDFTDIWTAWTFGYALLFSFMPLGLCWEWKKRGSSDGFSSFGFIQIFLMCVVCLRCQCWVLYCVLANDTKQLYLNLHFTVIFIIVLAVYIYYQSSRRTVFAQLVAMCATMMGIMFFVNKRPLPEAVEMAGKVATTVQTLSLSGIVYDIFRVLVFLKTTEYMPSFMTFGGTVIGFNFFLLGYLTDEYYMMISNVPGLFVNAFVFVLYAVYPPRTWRVPIIGTGPTEKQHSD